MHNIRKHWTAVSTNYHNNSIHNIIPLLTKEKCTRYALFYNLFNPQSKLKVLFKLVSTGLNSDMTIWIKRSFFLKFMPSDINLISDIYKHKYWMLLIKLSSVKSNKDTFISSWMQKDIFVLRLQKFEIKLCCFFQKYK